MKLKKSASDLSSNQNKKYKITAKHLMSEINQEVINFFPGNYNNERSVDGFTELTENLVIRLFQKTLNYLKPIDQLLYNKKIYINIDLTGFECTIVKFIPNISKSRINEFTFIVGPRLISNLLRDNESGEMSKQILKELLIMLDNVQINKYLKFRRNNNVKDIFKNYFYVLRSKGICNLIDLYNKDKLTICINKFDMAFKNEMKRLHEVEWETERNIKKLHYKIFDLSFINNFSPLLFINVLISSNKVRKNLKIKLICNKIKNGNKINKIEILNILPFALNLDLEEYYTIMLKNNELLSHLQKRIDLKFIYRKANL